MSRKKKRPSAAQRKQEEIQRRIKAAEEKAAKPAKKAATEKPEKPAKAATPEKPAVPDVKEKPAKAEAPERTVKPARTARPGMERGRAPVSSVLKMARVGDSGYDQCCNYDVTSTVRLDIKALFDAIRRERPGETGTVYITTNLAESSSDNYNLSYDYAAGLFTRREPLSGKKAAKNPALMADILDRPIKKIRAHGGWGQMSWYVNLAPDYGAENMDGTKGVDKNERHD